jgi:hypothetical protein
MGCVGWGSILFVPFAFEKYPSIVAIMSGTPMRKREVSVPMLLRASFCC